MESLNRRIDLFRENLSKWSQGQIRSFPWREDASPKEILIAEILLQKTPASRVEPIFLKLWERYPDFESLAAADVDQLASILEPLGLQNRKAKALISIGEVYADARLPETEAELMELPFVSRYTANATLCFGFGQRRAIVDGNVVRVYGRAFDTHYTPQEEAAWEIAEQVLPETGYQRFNLALLDFAAAICVPQTPKCGECFFSENCHYFQVTR